MKLDWKAALGLGITVFLLWFVMRDVPFDDVWASLKPQFSPAMQAGIPANPPAETYYICPES